MKFHWILHKRVLLACFGAVFLGTAFFGLFPRGFDFRNHVRWLDDGPGLGFRKFGIAYGRPFLFPHDGSKALSLELILRVEPGEGKGFQHILTFHSGEDTDQLMLGQWHDYLVFMKGNDYQNKRRGNKISVNVAQAFSREIFLTLTSGSTGTHVYLNGRLIRDQKDLMLDFPQGDRPGRLILGNSAYGKYYWEGALRGLAVHRTELSPERVALHDGRWRKERNFWFLKEEKPLLLYPFQEGKGARVADEGVGRLDLILPERMVVLKTRFLDTTFEAGKITGGIIEDLLLNWLGFIPFGLIGFFLSGRYQGRLSRLSMLVAVVTAGFLFSLSIELLQAWIPSRSSDALDLFLNTMGTLTGAVLGMILVTRMKTDDADDGGSDPL